MSNVGAIYIKSARQNRCKKLLLALLICHGAGSLASRLAGSLALAAAALDSAFLQIGFVESLDVLLHACYLQSFNE